MENFIEKLKKRKHRRADSSASQSSFVDDNTVVVVETGVSELWSDSSSFHGATLILRDDLTAEPPEKMGNSDRSYQWDLGEARENCGRLLRQRKSRLSTTLSDVLNDPTALGYFVTFMDERGYKHLIKFWLEAETFRAASLSTLQRNATTRNSPSDNEEGSAVDDVNGDKRSVVNGKLSKNLQQMTEQDAVAIFTKYISKEAIYSIGATDEIRSSVTNRICGADGRLDPDCFLPAQEFVRHIFENRFITDYLNSVIHCKYLLEFLTTGQLYITDILYNETALLHFAEFMESEGRRSLIEFWLAADNFHQHLSRAIESGSGYDAEQAQRDAMVLYDRYFSMQATTPLGFGDELRLEIENNICREGGPLADCFEIAVSTVMHVMEKKYLRSFLQSPLYTRYLSELVKASNTYDLDLPNPNRQKRASATGSTVSSGDTSSSIGSSSRQRNSYFSKDVLLAKSRTQQVESLTDAGNDLLIENQTCDPDSLWKRDKTKAGFARVDANGKYVREYSVATQHKRTKSGGDKLSDAVRKLVHKDSRREEEVAEQVAALIIRDITEMTKNTELES